jgi:hypothetical protein
MTKMQRRKLSERYSKLFELNNHDYSRRIRTERDRKPSRRNRRKKDYMRKK